MRSLWIWLALQNAPANPPGNPPVNPPAAPPAPSAPVGAPAGPAAPAPVDPAAPAAKPAAKDEKVIEPPRTPDAAITRLIDTLDANRVVATVNGEVVTLRDLLVMWKLEGRGSTDKERKAMPSDDDLRMIRKQIVQFRLWRMHARLFPAFVDFMTPARIDEFARGNFASLLQDPTLTEDEKAMLRERIEEELARLLVLDNDPEYKRVSIARPDDVQRWWDDPLHKDAHRVLSTATLGRVMLGRDVYGDKVETLARDLRQRAQEKGNLEAAAQDLAPGSYSEPPNLKGVLLEGPNVSLRDEVLDFAKTAQPGDLSAPVKGQFSVMIFVLISREEGHDRPFEKAAPIIKQNLESAHKAFRAEQYFITKILGEAIFSPDDLFDDEIDRLVPGNSARRKAEEARRRAAAAAAPANAGK